MAFGRGFSEQQILSVVQLCEMHDRLIYVHTKRNRLRVVQDYSFTCNKRSKFYV